VLVIPKRKGPFVPGRHQIKWSAKDSSGNKATVVQTVDIRPLLEFSPDQLASAGTKVEIHLLLNGDAPEYPVDIGYEIHAGTAITTGGIVIPSGTEAEIDYQVPANTPPGDIIFTLVSVSNAALGPQSSHTVTIVNENVAPVASFEVTQNGLATRVVTSDGRPVSVKVAVHDANTTDIHSFDWSMTDNNLLAISVINGSELLINDPSVLTAGIYPVEVTVTDDGEGLLDSQIQLLLTVLTAEPVLTDSDSDDDGIDDITEGFGDSDDDGIPDYMDGFDNPAAMQGKEGISNKWFLNVQPGLGIRLGNTPIFAKRATVNVTAEEIEQHSGKLGGPAPAEAIDTQENSGGIFDFEIHGLTKSGQSVLIVIPLHAAIPDNPAYRKYTEDNGWQDFVEDDRNSLASAAGESGANPPEAGICPPPGDPAFIPGLSPGHYCVQLMIEDGGPNDSDGRKNGVIVDPGGVAAAAVATDPVTSVSTTDSSGGGGSGGSIDLVTLILMIGLYLSLYRRNLRIRIYDLYRVS
jgi:hypothetical protein